MSEHLHVLIEKVAKHYGLSEANVRIMKQDARNRPIYTRKAYEAILNSLSYEPNH